MATHGMRCASHSAMISPRKLTVSSAVMLLGYWDSEMDEKEESPAMQHALFDRI